MGGGSGVADSSGTAGGGNGVNVEVSGGGVKRGDCADGDGVKRGDCADGTSDGCEGAVTSDGAAGGGASTGGNGGGTVGSTAAVSVTGVAGRASGGGTDLLGPMLGSDGDRAVDSRRVLREL